MGIITVDYGAIMGEEQIKEVAISGNWVAGSSFTFSSASIPSTAIVGGK